MATPKLAPDLRSHTILGFIYRSCILNLVNLNPTHAKVSPLFPFRMQKACYRSQKIMSSDSIKLMAATMIDKWGSPIWNNKLMPYTRKGYEHYENRALLCSLTHSLSLFWQSANPT